MFHFLSTMNTFLDKILKNLDFNSLKSCHLVQGFQRYAWFHYPWPQFHFQSTSLEWFDTTHSLTQELLSPTTLLTHIIKDPHFLLPTPFMTNTTPFTTHTIYNPHYLSPTAYMTLIIYHPHFLLPTPFITHIIYHPHHL